MSLNDVNPSVKKHGRRSHSPPKIKPTEQRIAYNPFWWDLKVDRPGLNPRWAQQPGITLNWLYTKRGVARGSELDEKSLILGVEADTPQNMKAFMDKFCPGHGLKEKDIKRLVMLGHPTLACMICSNKVAVKPVKSQGTGQRKVRYKYRGDKFVQDNYSGILGGELHYDRKAKRWFINYRSGRYGPQHIVGHRTRTKETVKSLFHRYCNVRVEERR